jgi:hypothetical protein
MMSLRCANVSRLIKVGTTPAPTLLIRHGELWSPAPLLERLAKSGGRFGDLDKEKAAASVQ